jgi:hypothetical protein
MAKLKDEEAAASRRITQSVLPRKKLREAMLIPQAILDHLGGKGSAPLQVAIAMDISPTSSGWRDITGAAIAYGLTEGGYNSDQIVVTDLGRRCVAPTVDGDDVKAKYEAGMRPQVLRQFFEKYDNAKFPGDAIAKNVLQHEFGVPTERMDEVLSAIKDNAAYIGIIHNTKTGPFVSLSNPEPGASISLPEVLDTGERTGRLSSEGQRETVLATPKAESVLNQQVGFKVFISHGRNMDVVEQVKDVLSLYDIEYEVAVEQETTAIPVPDKVMDAMRRCHAGIMVLTADQEAKVGDEYPVNNNVLIEIGAAFVLYNKRVVLLWDKRLKVPSNIQGLYRCEFEGNQLSFAVGTKLAKAIKGFKAI